MGEALLKPADESAYHFLPEALRMQGISPTLQECIDFSWPDVVELKEKLLAAGPNSQPVTIALGTGGTFLSLETATGRSPNISLQVAVQQIYEDSVSNLNAPSGLECIDLFYKATGDNLGIDSTDFKHDYRVYLASVLDYFMSDKRVLDQVHGFIIVKGTDTVKYTGPQLSYMMGQGLPKNVMIVTAQNPIGVERSDAPIKFKRAIEAIDGFVEAGIAEIAVIGGDRVIPATHALKSSSRDFNTFKPHGGFSDEPQQANLSTFGRDGLLNEIAEHAIRVDKRKTFRPMTRVPYTGGRRTIELANMTAGETRDLLKGSAITLLELQGSGAGATDMSEVAAEFARNGKLMSLIVETADQVNKAGAYEAGPRDVPLAKLGKIDTLISS